MLKKSGQEQSPDGSPENKGGGKLANQIVAGVGLAAVAGLSILNKDFEHPGEKTENNTTKSTNSGNSSKVSNSNSNSDSKSTEKLTDIKPPDQPVAVPVDQPRRYHIMLPYIQESQ